MKKRHPERCYLCDSFGEHLARDRGMAICEECETAFFAAVPPDARPTPPMQFAPERGVFDIDMSNPDQPWRKR